MARTATTLIFAAVLVVALSSTTAVLLPNAVGLARLERGEHFTAWAGAGLTLVSKTDAEWNAMSKFDFAAYRAVAIMDPTCEGGAGGTAAFLIANAANWGQAANGNVIVIGTDEQFHGGSGGNAASNQFAKFIAADAAKTGAYISLSCYYHGVEAGTNIDFLNVAFAHLSATPFQATGVGCYNDARIVASHPAMAGLVDATLSNWSCSVHEGFSSFPAYFEVLAVAAGIGGGYTSADGSIVGTPYVIARGVTVESDIKLTPETQSQAVDDSAVVTATVSTDGVAVEGVTVTFTVLEGVHAGLTGSAVTNAAGKASWSVAGTELGYDLIQASATVAGVAQRSNRAEVKWFGIVEYGTCGRPQNSKIIRGTTPAVVGRSCVCELDHCFQCRFTFRGRALLMDAAPSCERCEVNWFWLAGACVETCPEGYDSIIKLRPAGREMGRGRQCVKTAPPPAPAVISGPINGQ